MATKTTKNGILYLFDTDEEGNATHITAKMPLVTPRTDVSKSGKTVGYADMIPNTEITLAEILSINGSDLGRRFGLGLSLRLWLKPKDVIMAAAESDLPVVSLTRRVA